MSRSDGKATELWPCPEDKDFYDGLKALRRSAFSPADEDRSTLERWIRSSKSESSARCSGRGLFWKQPRTSTVAIASQIGTRPARWQMAQSVYPGGHFGAPRWAAIGKTETVRCRRRATDSCADGRAFPYGLCRLERTSFGWGSWGCIDSPGLASASTSRDSSVASTFLVYQHGAGVRP